MDDRLIVGGNNLNDPNSLIVGIDSKASNEKIEEPQMIAMKQIEFTLGDAVVAARQICFKNKILGSIATCRALGLALSGFGIDCIPVTTRTVIFNPYVAKEFKPERMPSKKRIETLLNHPKGYSVGLGMEEAEGDGWKGHLVLLANTSSGIVLLDPTLDQANRPKHKIRLIPIALKLNPDFTLHDGARLAFNINDCAIMYNLLPSDQSFQNVNDWTLQTAEFDVNNISNQIFEQLMNLTA